MKLKIFNESCNKLHVLNKQEELLENPTLERQKEDNQQPSLDSNISEGSTTNTQDQTNNVEVSNGDTSILPIWISEVDTTHLLK